MNSTYSFADVQVTISHPSVGQYIANGQGIGSLNIVMSGDKTAHDVSADGSVMVSKIKNRAGTIAMSIQQTSALNKFLLRWINYLETAAAGEWANTVLLIKSLVTSETITATMVSPQKHADKPYQVQGQQITWNVMSADIQQDPF